MLNKLKKILNTYSKEELEKMNFWINSSKEVSSIIVDSNSIDIITKDASVEINGKRDQ